MRGRSKNIGRLELKQKAEKAGCKSGWPRRLWFLLLLAGDKPNMSLRRDWLRVLCRCFVGCSSLTLFLTPIDQTLMLTQIPKLSWMLVLLAVCIGLCRIEESMLRPNWKGVLVLLEVLELLRTFPLEKKQFRRNNKAIYTYLKDHQKEVGLGLFSVANCY